MMKKFLGWLSAATFVVALILIPASSSLALLKSEKVEKKLKVGDAFPDVAVQVTDVKKILGKEKKTIKISDLKGKHVVVWFFPKAMTGG
ncbi:MAG: hypothetical protein MK103_05310 [Planctomycetes bacterium]|nr:hypothetical protein [Planctomycetota bacterium]